MIRLILSVTLALVSAAAADPLRVLIRYGEKTHGPGAHDYPSFARDWTALLGQRGASASSTERFPTQEELAETDVLVLHAADAGNIHGDDREHLEAFLARGGGVVAIHAGAVSDDPDWYKTVIGGSWRAGQTKWLEGPMSLYFTDRDNDITRDCSNFDLDDEIYYDMDLSSDIRILAAAFTPKGKGRNGEQVNIHDIQPQMWTYEGDHHRAFVCLPGHMYENFSHVSLRTILLRGIAWAGKREHADELCLPSEVGEALRYPVGGPLRPEEAAATIELHPEFELSLVAAEPLINKAMNIDWDPQGRLWVAETPEYPNGLRRANTEEWKESGALRPGDYDRDPLDRISILSDTDGDGMMDTKHVFADKLELITSFVFHEDGVIVSAAPHIWFLEDTTGDEVADRRTKLYTGLGDGDTHAVINNLRRGLDGWIYATHGYSGGEVTALHGEDGSPRPPVRIGSGVVRFKPDGSRIEQYASRGGNTWGLDMTWDGQCFWTQPTSGTLFFHTVLPEHVLAKGRMPGVNGSKGMISGQKVFPLMKWEQQAYRQIDQVGSYTAAAGCAIYQGGAWPERWNYSYFTGEPTVNLVSHYFVEPDGVSVTTRKEAGREETEFIRSSDLWFRPIETRVGPDGALYVIDFYNQAVIHNDTRGPRHGPANAAVRPDRDHYFGRIWRVQHKQAERWEIPVLDKDDTAGLVKTIEESPNAHLKHTAWRLLNEAGDPVETAPEIAAEVAASIGSSALRAYREMRNPETAERRAELFERFAAAEDDWTRSAMIAAAGDFPTPTVAEALVSAWAAELGPLVEQLVPRALEADGDAAAVRFVLAAEDAPAAATGLKSIILQALAGEPDLKPAITPELAEAFAGLLADPELGAQALPIIAAWDREGAMAGVIEQQTEMLAATLEDRSASQAARANAAGSLIRLGTDGGLDSVVSILTRADESRALQQGIIARLGESGHAGRIVPVFASLPAELQSRAFDEILRRPEAVGAFLDSMADGTIEATGIAPGDLARLRSHPDKSVSTRANELLDERLPGVREKAELVASLLPEVTKPGDATQGEMLFGAACAVCHKYNDLGTRDVGPPLTGMGAHGAEELLTHIVDPNREVDPSFWQWNITTDEGETFAGVIVSENPAILTLRHQAGDTTIRKSDIATRENTHRSLMPEGLEGLGAEGLRDLIAYMQAGDSPFRVIDLREAYTADARRGLFASEDERRDSVFPESYGNITVEGIPFFLMDPEKSRDGKSLVVLKGGPPASAASRHPQTVRIPVRAAARRLHLLSGIAGWGYPATDDDRPAMKVTVTREDGGEEVVELLNGREFADYNREIDVTGSKLVEGVVRRGQIRLVTVELEKSGPITGVTLESYDNVLAPVVLAITADSRDQP